MSYFYIIFRNIYFIFQFFLYTLILYKEPQIPYIYDYVMFKKYLLYMFNKIHKFNIIHILNNKIYIKNLIYLYKILYRYV